MKNIKITLMAVALATVAIAKLQANADLMEAVKRNNIQEAMRILTQQKPSQKMKNDAFLRATEEGNLRMVTNLVKHGANINARNREGRNALMIASELGRKDIVRYILDKGIRKNLRDKHGKTAAQIAQERGHEAIVRLINGNDVLHRVTKHVKEATETE
jgi:ankyrin repeat protein